MKFLTFALGVLLLAMSFSCSSDEQKTVEVVEIQKIVDGPKTTIIERLSDGTKRVCVECSNGYKFCCDSPKSPSVNCVTKTGKCETSSWPTPN